MKTPRQPLFLARETYRRRRLMDAARMLPVFGMFMFALPVFWGPDDPATPQTASEGLYLFAIWFGLIAAAFIFARGLAPVADEGQRDNADPDRGGEG